MAGSDETPDKEELETRLLHLEESLRLLLRHVQAVTWTTDTDLRFTSLEGPALLELGLDVDEVVGKDLKDVQLEGDSGVLISPRALEGEVLTAEHVWRGRRIATTVEPLRDLEGNIIGTMGVAVLLDKLDQAEEVRTLRSAVQEARFAASGSRSGGSITVGDLVINPAAFGARKGRKRLSLSPTEFRLLLMLAERAGETLSRESLLESVWGYEFLGESRLVDMTVSRLRQKIEDDPSEPKVVVTERGVGYRLEGGGSVPPA